MFPEGVLASAMALLSQFFAASAGVSAGFLNAGRGSVVFSVRFRAGLDGPTEAERNAQ
jgi:hypothetical protein